MTTPDGDVPEWIQSRIDPGSYDMDLTQRHVALEFVYGDRPFYTVAQMHAAVGNEVSEDTVRSRMDELDERDVVRKQQVNNGNIYWLNREESEWPIPSDVEVEPVREELTVSEWRRQPHVVISAFAILLAVLGTALTLVGVFQVGGYYSLPVNAEDVIALGLSIVIGSYLALFFAGLVWVVGRPVFEEVNVLDWWQD